MSKDIVQVGPLQRGRIIPSTKSRACPRSRMASRVGTLSVERRRTTFDALDDICLCKKKFGAIGAILPGCAGNERDHSAITAPRRVSFEPAAPDGALSIRLMLGGEDLPRQVGGSRRASASPRWPHPVAKSRPRCKAHRWRRDRRIAPLRVSNIRSYGGGVDTPLPSESMSVGVDVDARNPSRRKVTATGLQLLPDSGCTPIYFFVYKA